MTKMSTVSGRGAFSIAAEEALVPTRYKDMRGIDTFGVGHTQAAGGLDPRLLGYEMPGNVDAAIREAWTLFTTDLRAYTAQVVKVLGPMEQHELDGWVMWHFNTGGLHSTSAVKKWLAGDKKGAVAILQQWNKVTVQGKKVVSDSLTERREREAAMILFGKYPVTLLNVFPTNGKGKVIWNPIASYSYNRWQQVIMGGGIDAEIALSNPEGTPPAMIGVLAYAAAILAASATAMLVWLKEFFQ